VQNVAVFFVSSPCTDRGFYSRFCAKSRNFRHSAAMDSPASRRATNCSLSLITEHSFHRTALPPLSSLGAKRSRLHPRFAAPSPHSIPCQPTPQGESVTDASGTKCYLRLGRSSATSEGISIWLSARRCALMRLVSSVGLDFASKRPSYAAEVRSALGSCSESYGFFPSARCSLAWERVAPGAPCASEIDAEQNRFSTLSTGLNVNGGNETGINIDRGHDAIAE